MTNLKKIKEDQTRIAEVYNITSSLKLVASTQSRQFAKRKKNYEPIMHQARKVMQHVIRDTQLGHDANDLHLVFSCDQKFCKNFLSMLNQHLSSFQFGPTSKIMLFGSRSYAVLLETVKREQIELYKALISLEECESIAVKIRSLNYPTTYIHGYDEAIKSFTATELIPFKGIDSEAVALSEYKVEDVLQLYLSSEIYYRMLQTGLKERVDRAMSMSEASENAKSKAKELVILYNKTRQSLITKEITSGS